MSKSKAVAAQPVPASPKGGKKKYEDYEVESAMRTLTNAEKHKQDPHLMKKVHALAGRHMKALKGIRSIKDLKDLRDEKFGYKTDEGDDNED